MSYQVKLNAKIWAVLLVLISIIALIIKYTFLTEKFFNDSITLLSLSETGNSFNDFGVGSFAFAAKFFQYINFFDINNLLDWSIYITIIFFFINFYLLKNIRSIKAKNLLIILVGLFLWYLFSAGITKEVIQSLFFLSIYCFVYTNKKIKSNFKKVLLGSIILFISSILFREYYILVAIFSILIYLIYNRIRNSCQKKYYIKFFIIYIIFFSLFLLIISIILPDEYATIINLRTETYLYLIELGTDSFINNIFEGDSLLIYIVNYTLNYFRLLFPLELLLIGKFYYIPFVIYQVYFSYYYIKNISLLNTIDNEKFVSIIFITSFLLISAIMEPDFGSWVRHQSVCYIFIISILKN